MSDLLADLQQQVTRESERTRGWTVRAQQLPEPDRWGSASHLVYGPARAADRPIVASKLAGSTGL